MRDLKTKAIVLKRTDYGEADRILQLLTPDGKRSVIARGARKEKSKLAGGIMNVGNAKMIISRGCGNSALPIRVFNPPEISLTILKSKK